MNNWYVANYKGDVIGHDLSEEKAKLLAAEMQAKKIYYIEYYTGADNGIVTYNNNPGNSLDYALTFDTEEEAEKTKDKLQEEWTARLRVTYTTDDSWEAMSGEE